MAFPPTRAVAGSPGAASSSQKARKLTTGLPAFQNLMEELMAADLKIDRYMTYLATRDVKSARPDLARLLAGPRR